MINVIKSEDRYSADHGWLLARWHFSFGDYHDPANMNWSALRVFNDDVIQPGQGFPAHPHRDMEIITYVLEGAVQHGDNLGNKGIIHAGEVQVMSAGKGIVHSEANASKDEPVHLLQLWIMPRTRGLKPHWEQRSWSGAAGDGNDARDGKLHAVVSDGHMPGTLAIDQDATIYVGKLPAGGEVVQEIGDGRNVYLFVIEGEITVNGTVLSSGDHGRISGETRLVIAAKKNAHVILLDLP